MIFAFLLSFHILFCLIPLKAAADFSAEVITVDDGDTIIVLHDGNHEHIRLNGIDAPEKTQAYGKKAKEFTTAATLGKMITIIEYGKDKHGRTIGDVVLPDGSNLNQQLLKEGLAWWYWEHSEDKVLKDIAEEAQDEKRGLWRDRHPIPPWVYRKIGKKQVPEVADFEPPKKLPATQTQGPIIGHRKSHIYQRPGCPGYGKVSGANAVQFSTVQEAEEAGYKIAKNCPR
jgi:endonuclease YncB( thermonuclease family)